MTEHDSPDDILLAALAGLLPAQEPAAPVRLALRERILAQATRPKGMTVLRADQGEWRPILPGIRIKSLRKGDGTETTLWRIEAGAVVPAHPHRHQEECLVLEGSVVQDGVEYFAGDFLLAEAGLPHDEFHSPRGALLMIRSEPVPDPGVLASLQGR
jgi:anti-sigma factor ChrR (cupin superfamily)